MNFPVRTGPARMCLMLLVCAFFLALPSHADDCKRIQNILVLFDASGQMKDHDKYQTLLQKMNMFVKGMPLLADGFFNVGLRHYGLKVGLGCENTESILAVQPWDPERFMNAFPKSISYGVSSLSAGLRAAADDVAGLSGKSVILVIGAGVESCKTDPIQIAERICQNNPDLEIHTFQVGSSPDGRYFLRGIAEKCRGVYIWTEEITNPAGWYSWMKKYLLMPCAGSAPAAGAAPAQSIGAVTFDNNSFSVASREPSADAANKATLQAVANALRVNPGARVVLHGFSDGKGKPAYNLKLSKQRGESVAKYLIGAYGLSPTQISIVAHGEGNSMMANPAPVNERFGRRVEFEILQ